MDILQYTIQTKSKIKNFYIRLNLTYSKVKEIVSKVVIFAKVASILNIPSERRRYR